MVRIVIFALSLALTGVAGEASAARRAQGPALVLLLATDQPAYEGGMPATFTIAVDNPGYAPVTVQFPSAQEYDILVYAGEREVWRWSADRVFAAAVTERSFPPGVTLLGRETWDWRDSSGAPLPSGSYRAIGTLTGMPARVGNVVEISLSGS